MYDTKENNICPCCKDFNFLVVFDVDDEKCVFFECDGQFLRAYDNDPTNYTIEKTEINYCPMCGRKLLEDEK